MNIIGRNDICKWLFSGYICVLESEIVLKINHEIFQQVALEPESCGYFIKAAINLENIFTILSYDSENFMKVSLGITDSADVKRVFLVNFPKGIPNDPKRKVKSADSELQL